MVLDFPCWRRQIRTPARQTRDDGWVKAIYPDSGDGDRVTHPDAVPGLHPPEGAADVTSFTLEVDGELFADRPNEFGGTDYSWLSGPNPGYRFGVSPTANLSLGEHMDNVRDFLAIVDPTTDTSKTTSSRAVLGCTSPSAHIGTSAPVDGGSAPGARTARALAHLEELGRPAHARRSSASLDPDRSHSQPLSRALLPDQDRPFLLRNHRRRQPCTPAKGHA
jgi:hypothetical protein